MPKKYDMVGQMFGNLTVLENLGSDGSHIKYKCRCTCGREVTVRGTDLRFGSSKSCGSAGCKFKKYVTPDGKYMGNIDCFAYVKRQGGAVCSALSEMMCAKGECKFYATLEEVCSGCYKNCYKCLTVSHQKQTQYKQKGEA